VSDHLERLASSLDPGRESADPGDDVVEACRTRIAALRPVSGLFKTGSAPPA